MTVFKYLLFVLLLFIGAILVTSCEKEITESENPLELWQALSNDVIVWTSRMHSPGGELYLLEKNGEVIRLTNNDRHENNPALSPDRTKIAFHAGSADDPLSWEIYHLNRITSVETQLTLNNVIDGHPDWSPDGEKIIFASFRDEQGNPAGTADIYVVNADGKDLVRLTDSEWEDNDPEWSPDGSMIAFKSNRYTQIEAREEIFIMDADGANVQKLTGTMDWQSDHDPSWSPDGAYIVFSRFQGSRPWFDIANPNWFSHNLSENGIHPG
jgi:Tol biopolymer transport system component